jgi:hypothetical protein
MSSNNNSINNSNSESIPFSSRLSMPLITTFREIKTLESNSYNVEFKKTNGNNFEIFARCNNKNYKSKEISFDRIKLKNDIKYEKIDVFIKSINIINNEKDSNNIMLYFDSNDSNNLRIRYNKLCKNEYEGYPITFLVKEEMNNTINNDLNNSSFNLQKNINIDDKLNIIHRIASVNNNIIKNLLEKLPLILYKNKQIKERFADSINKNKEQLDFDLLFSLARDGNDIRNFHNLVKNKTPTLLLFETYDKKIFFYYIPISWECETNNDIKIKPNEQIFLYNLKTKKKINEKNTLAIGCHSSYGPMIGKFDKDETKFIENLDFDCSISFYEAFTNNESISKNGKIKIKELEIYKINFYNN